MIVIHDLPLMLIINGDKVVDLQYLVKIVKARLQVKERLGETVCEPLKRDIGILNSKIDHWIRLREIMSFSEGMVSKDMPIDARLIETLHTQLEGIGISGTQSVDTHLLTT